MNKSKFLSLIFLGALCLMGCKTNNSEKNSSDSLPIDEEDLSLRFSFEEENNTVLESVSNKQYPINYIFKDAAYKKSENIRRIPGISGKALSFDGNSVSFESDPISFNENAFTLSFYIAPIAYERTDGVYTSILSNISNSGGIEFAISSYGYYKIIVGTTKGKLQAIVTDSPLSLHQWTHIAIVYSKKNSKVTLYADGVEKSMLDLKGGTVVSSDETFLVGKSRYGLEESVFELNHFNGFLDEIKIYNQALNQNQISSFADLAKTHKDETNNEMWFPYSLLATDRYAPQYHMRQPLGWSNEFYGGFYFNEQYHIFSQHNPFRAIYQNGQRWGHLSSQDLVHWKALYPVLNCEENRIDNSQCFSGSVLMDNDGNPMIFYTGINERQEYINNISIATPSDLNDKDLVDWTKSNKKVVEQGQFGSYGEFRDPFIYKENNKYFMIIGGDATEGNGAAYIYKATSDTFDEWQPLGVLYSGSTSQYPVLGTTYELPNLFKLTNKDGTISKYMLMISPIRVYNGVYYWLGDFNLDTGVFTPEKEEPSKIDLGPSNKILAASGFYDEHKNRTIFTTMVRANMSDDDAKLLGWNNGHTLWKELYLSDDGNEIRFAPIEEYQSLEKDVLLNMPSVSLSEKQADSIFSQIHSDQYRLDIEIDPNGEKEVGVMVKTGAKGEKVVYSYNYDTKQFYCNNARSSFAMKNNGSGGGTVDIGDNNLKLTIYVDRSLVEGYIEDKNEISVFAFNSYEESNSIKMYSDNGNALVKSIKLVSLSDAYGQNQEAYWG